MMIATKTAITNLSILIFIETKIVIYWWGEVMVFFYDNWMNRLLRSRLSNPSRVAASFFSLMKRNKNEERVHEYLRKTINKKWINPAYRQAGKAHAYLSFRLNKSLSTILSGVNGFCLMKVSTTPIGLFPNSVLWKFLQKIYLTTLPNLHRPFRSSEKSCLNMIGSS